MTSDHDAPHVCINALIKCFHPRYKMIRNEREFDEIKFLQDSSEPIFNANYSTDDIDDKLDLFNSLLPTFLGRHGLLKTRSMVEIWRHPPYSSADRGNCFVIKLTQINSEDEWKKLFTQNKYQGMRRNQSTRRLCHRNHQKNITMGHNSPNPQSHFNSHSCRRWWVKH